MKQKLRFENFLKDYVRDLSFGTTSIKKLVAECEDFPKLREPLFLYAKFNGKLKLLYSVLEKTPNGELQHLCDTYRECRNTPCFSYGDIRHNVIELLLKHFA